MKRSNILLTILIVLLLSVHFLLFVRSNNCIVSNTGFAFGIAGEYSSQLSFIISIFAIFFVIGMLSFFKEIRKEYLIYLLILSLGNIFDRLFNGICDYIQIFKFPVFNLLDLGIILILIAVFADIIRNGQNRNR